MYILGTGVDQEDYARLMQHAEIPSDDRYTSTNMLEKPSCTLIILLMIPGKPFEIFNTWELRFLMRCANVCMYIYT